MNTEYWALNMDDFGEDVFSHMEHAQDGKAGHTVAFQGDRVEAKQRMLIALAKLIDKKMYQSNAYGTPIEDMQP